MCAGLRYLAAGLALGAFFAHLNTRSTPRRLGVIALAVVFAILVNWVRIYVVIMAGHMTDMKHPLVSDHITFGWIAFAVAFIPFWMLASRLVD